MKNLTIDYKKEFGNDGTVYTQTIKIPFNIAFEFNLYVNELKEKTEKKSFYTSEDLKILDYLMHINFYNKTFINLTTLDYFKTFYIKKIYKPAKRDLDFERIKWRNTIIKVK